MYKLNTKSWMLLHSRTQYQYCSTIIAGLYHYWVSLYTVTSALVASLNTQQILNNRNEWLNLKSQYYLFALNYFSCVTDLSEQFQEVIDVGGAHGLGDVALVLEVVLAGVGRAHPQSVEGANLQPAAITLK